MSFPRAKPSVAARSQSALVWLLAGIVFALGLINASPSAHDRLHSHDHEHAVVHDDLGCAVTLFAHGATPPLNLPRVVAPRPVFITSLAADPLHLLLSAAHHLTPPGCGPPDIG
ncbi:MAG: hypothetical protein H7Y06_01125 [Opitutaceae bacterium]|nr:hypothetical protein [Opitutaceae bacterium]